MRGFESPRFPGRPANTRDMMLLLGVKGAKWPRQGVKTQFIQNKWVGVLPWDHVSLGKQEGVRSVKHRVIASCPDCGAAVSASRLPQHVCDSTRARRRLSKGEAPGLQHLLQQRAKAEELGHGDKCPG